MEARVLLQGHARVGSWMAIQVEFTNAGPAIDGELRIAGGSQGRTRFSVAVNLPTDSRKVYLLYAQPPAFGRSVKVELVSGSTTAAAADVAYLVHDSSQLVIGVVAEKPQGIVGELDLDPSPNGTVPAIVSLGVADLPERIEGWATLDRLIWQDMDSNTLTAAQLAALRGWIAGGGRLVIAGGTAGIGTLSGFPDDLLPYRPSVTVDIAPEIDRRARRPASRGRRRPPGAGGIPRQRARPGDIGRPCRRRRSRLRERPRDGARLRSDRRRGSRRRRTSRRCGAGSCPTGRAAGRSSPRTTARS